jgi:hypothetical protein
MPLWAWVLIAVGAAAVVGALIWLAIRQRRTSRLRGRFGPEYERLESLRGRREAESELAERERRREELEIRPLSDAARQHYVERWQVIQARFVDAPQSAVRDADQLISQVMHERGYPVEDFEQRAADVSVDHSEVVEDYRRANRLVISSEATTEDLRQAMQHYRALFAELVEETADEPTTAERVETETDVREEQPARR